MMNNTTTSGRNVTYASHSTSDFSIRSSNTSTTINTQSPNTRALISSSQNSQSAGGGCNERLKHSHEEKAVFHGMKSAFRMVSTGQKGVDDTQPEEAARIAANVAIAYLKSEGLEYDRSRSKKHLHEKVLDKLFGGGDVDELEAGIGKAWRKIDSGNHKGGARVAIAAAEEYLNEEIW